MKDKHWAIICHVVGMLGGMYSNIIGFAACISIWSLFASSENELLDRHGKAAANFYASMCIYTVIITCIITVTSLFSASKMGLSIEAYTFAIKSWLSSGQSCWKAVESFKIFFVIIGISRAAQERDFKYPLSIRFIK